MRGRGRPAFTLPEAWETAIVGWICWLTASGKTTATVNLRRGVVRFIARECGTDSPAGVTTMMLIEICGPRSWSLEHRRSVRAALVSFFDWCAAYGLVGGNPAEQMPPVKAAAPRPRPAPDDVWAELVAAAGPRELLMIRLAGEAGLRRGEVARCRRDDVIRDPRGALLVVHGKGGKQRVIPISDSLLEAIQDYRPIGSGPTGYLFPGIVDGHLSEKYVGELISALMPDGWSMHKLRHRFATRAYRGTRNLRAVQTILGHSSVATTERYTAVDDDEIRAAMMAAL